MHYTPEQQAQLNQYIAILALIISSDPEFFKGLYQKILAEEDFTDGHKIGFSQISNTFHRGVAEEFASFREKIRQLIETEIHGDFTAFGIPPEIAPVVNKAIRVKMLELIQQQGIESAFRAGATIDNINANPNVLNIANLVPDDE